LQLVPCQGHIDARLTGLDWLAEDVPAFDYGGLVVGEKIETAVLLCKSPGVLAGAQLVLLVA